jgi:hypothetical protein
MMRFGLSFVTGLEMTYLDRRYLMSKSGLLIESDIALELIDGMEGCGGRTAQGLDLKIVKAECGPLVLRMFFSELFSIVTQFPVAITVKIFNLGVEFLRCCRLLGCNYHKTRRGSHVFSNPISTSHLTVHFLSINKDFFPALLKYSNSYQ